MKIYRAYKFRLYPNEEQKILIHKTFGCVRLVYNYYLAYQKKNGVVKPYTLCKNLKELEMEKEFLKEVDVCSLRCAIFDLADGFNNYFAKRGKYPKFKSKFSRQSYRTNCIRRKYKEKDYSNIEVDVIKRYIKLPKLGKVRIRGYRNQERIEGRIINVSIIKEKSNKYYASVIVEEELLKEKVNPATIVGIDLGIKDLVVTSDGIKYRNEKVLVQYEKRIRRLQKKLSRQIKGSKNYEKTREKLARIHEKIKNRRRQYLNDIANEIVEEHDIIVTEDLKVNEMLKGKEKGLNKSIIDASFRKICCLIEWKSKIKGKYYYKINSYYPSSQICSRCGYQNKGIRNLSIREYECPNCGGYNDRDINASINILMEGLKLHYQH